MRGRTRTIILLVVAAVVLGGIAYGIHESRRAATVTILSAKSDRFGSDLARAFGILAHEEHPRVRIRTIQADTPDAAQKAFERGEGDLIVTRVDSAPKNASTIGIVRRQLMFFIVPHSVKASSIAGLRNHRIAIFGADTRNEALLKNVLDHYRVSDPNPLFIAEADLDTTLKSEKIGALFMVTPVGSPNIMRAYNAVRKAGGGAPTVLLVDEADAISKQVELLESTDTPKGVLIGSPAVPDDDDLSTLSISERLLVNTSIPNAIAAEITRMLFKDRARIAPNLPKTTEIEQPDTDTFNASLPIHPGAYNFLTGNQPSMSDQAQDALYWVGLMTTGLGSLTAAFLAITRRFRTPPLQKELHRFIEIWAGCEDADEAGLAAYHKEVDTMLQTILRGGKASEDPTIERALPLIVNQIRMAMDRRAKELEKGSKTPRPAQVAVAAEPVSA